MANYRIGRKRRGVTWSNNVTEGNSRLVFKRDLEFAMDTQRVQKHAGRNCGNGLSIRYVAPREGLSYGFQLTHVGWYGKWAKSPASAGAAVDQRRKLVRLLFEAAFTLQIRGQAEVSGTATR